MASQSLLQKVSQKLRHRSFPTRKNLINRRLLLEQLEDRVVLSTLLTDQPDYAPGSVVTFQGSGFQAGEAVNVNIASSNGGNYATKAPHGPDGPFTAAPNWGFANITATLA